MSLPQETEQVLDACPTVHWRALFGLARLAGLRVPSEAHTVGWSDVDWGRGRLTVHAPKTEGRANKGRRVVPISPRLAEILQDAFDAAEPGPERIIPLSRNNLNRNLRVILKRASVTP